MNIYNVTELSKGNACRITEGWKVRTRL